MFRSCHVIVSKPAKLGGVICLIILLSFGRLLAQGVQFEEELSWEKIKEKALNEHRNIFVDVYATWCAPCKRMDQEVYTKEEVGRVLNEKFISVKVQQDRTKADGEYTRSWYTDADNITKEYKIDALPGFLFFSPNGQLIHKSTGFQDSDTFLSLVKLALTDPVAAFQQKLSAYKNGHKDYPSMPDLINGVTEIDKDEKMAALIAKDYKENYLDKLSEEELCQRKYLDFIGDYFNLIKSDDKFFSLCYHHPEKVDKIKDFAGWSDFQVLQTITREDVDEPLNKNKDLVSEEDWRVITQQINAKYPKVDARKLVLDAQLRYYLGKQDYRQVVKFKNRQNKYYPPKIGTGANSDSWTLNFYAWTLFSNSTDKELLSHALNWINLSIELDSRGSKVTGEAPNIQLYDTKANLLYKLGQVPEAIAWEEKALQQGITNAQKRGVKEGDFYDDFSKVLKKMRTGEPTW